MHEGMLEPCNASLRKTDASMLRIAKQLQTLLDSCILSAKLAMQ